jgi:hypothetical protein
MLRYCQVDGTACIALTGTKSGESSCSFGLSVPAAVARYITGLDVFWTFDHLKQSGTRGRAVTHLIRDYPQTYYALRFALFLSCWLP